MNPDLYASLPPNKSPRGRSILNKIESELIKCCNDKLKWSCCIYSIGRAEYVDIVVYNIGPFHRAYIKFYNILWSMHWDWNEYHYSNTRITKLKGKELEWISENYEALEWGVK